MGTALLATKLFVPPSRSGVVRRPRLMEQLRKGLNRSLILVSAPAGYGKTTLVSDWVQQNHEHTPAAWFALDEQDNDPVRFWDYFIAALQTIESTTGETALSLLHSPQPCPPEAVLTALINDLMGFPSDFVTVLDDYHLIKAEAIQSGITFLLEHLPPKMHLVIATRNDPPLALAHFRGRGTILEIGADDLRFTVAETAQLLAEVLPLKLAAADISALNERTEGWAVGLTMAMLSINKEKDIPGFIARFTGSQRYVMDYLIEEVLEQQSDELRAFLLNTSILERLNASLCDFLNCKGGSRETLAKLESSLAGFLIPLDEAREWYRYHHLFAELLRHQLKVKLGEEGVQRLHLRASQWYEDNKFPDDAVRHALGARDWEGAARLIEELAETRYFRGEVVTLLSWLKRIPEETIQTHHHLSRRFTAALIDTGELDRAERALTYLEQMSSGDTNLQGENALMRADIAWYRGDVSNAAKLTEEALSMLDPQNFKAYSRAKMFIGRVQYGSGLLDKAETSLTDAYDGAQLSGNHWIMAMTLAVLGAILVEQGRLHHAAEKMRQAVGLDQESPASAMPRITLGYILYEWNDLDGASRELQRAIELSQLSGSFETMTNGYVFLALTKLAQEDTTGIAGAIQNSDRCAGNPSVASTFRAVHAAFRFLMAVKQDDATEAADWGTRLQKYGSLPSFVSHVPARVLIANGEKAIAAAQLKSLCEKSAKAGWKFCLIHCRVYQAIVADTPTEALTFLTEALKMGQPEGFIRTFVDEGKLLAPLLRKALAQGVTPEYTARLLSIIDAEELRRQAVNRKDGLLSERELDVLRLLAAGLSNLQIAEKLVISLSTAKTHVHNIAEKLVTRSRSQAIARARELKLI